MSRTHCKFVGLDAKCRRLSCSYYGLVHPKEHASKPVCAYDLRPRGCINKECKFKHMRDGLERITISAPGDTMRYLLKHKASVLKRIKKMCKTVIEVSPYKKEIYFQGEPRDIQTAKVTMYQELKYEGFDFLQLRNEVKGSKEGQKVPNRPKTKKHGRGFPRCAGLDKIANVNINVNEMENYDGNRTQELEYQNAVAEKFPDEFQAKNFEVAEFRRHMHPNNIEVEDLRRKLHAKNFEVEEPKNEEKYRKELHDKKIELDEFRRELHAKNIEVEDLRRELHDNNIGVEELKNEEKYWKGVWDKCNEKNKLLKTEKEDIKREHNIKIEAMQMMNKELILKNEKLQSEKRKIEKDCSNLKIELNSLKIKKENQTGNENVETMIREKEIEYQALKEQLTDKYIEMEITLTRKADDMQKKDTLIQGLEERVEEMVESLKEMREEKNQNQKDKERADGRILSLKKESKMFQKNYVDAKRILKIRNNELKLYKDILAHTDSDEDGKEDAMETDSTIIKKEGRIESNVDDFHGVSESWCNLDIKDEIDNPEQDKDEATNIKSLTDYQIIILD
eukprot:GFUD01027860.1.p1 GENE.GFUD01027860.1~~GFUD01027860.1.p1  ORF type:complete len:565 (+),score=160.72 GFUD01027860.1:44-1738(+)